MAELNLHGYEKFFRNDNTTVDDMITIMSNNSALRMADLVPDIEFAAPDGHSLLMQLILPRWRKPSVPMPLIVFVQGSSWTNPNAHWEIPQLSRFAQAGFIVASVTHRSSRTKPFPACLIDVKSAIRYLRAHAAEYCIDKERVAIWGTSSGGNLALLTAATEGMAEFEQGDNLSESSAVQAVVDFFGPTDVNRMIELGGYTLEQIGQLPNPEENVLYTLIGGVEGDARGRMAKLTPAGYLAPDAKLPPHLLVHGDCDSVVPFSQSVEYYNELRSRNIPSVFVKVSGGEHEARFWSDELLDTVMKFLNAYLV